jgi:hypothetical protein
VDRRQQGPGLLRLRHQLPAFFNEIARSRTLALGFKADLPNVASDLVPAFDPDPARIVRGFTAVARDLPAGCLAAYYPEANALVVLADHDARSGTPAYKSIPVRLRRSERR